MDLLLEDERVKYFFPLPTGQGNAAEDMMEATHQIPLRSIGITAMPYQGFERISLEVWEGPDNRDKWRLLELSVLPKVETCRRAGRRVEYRMWGEVALIPRDDFSPLPLINYQDFDRMNTLCIIRAREAASEGQYDQALAWYRDLMLINNHLERDTYQAQIIAI